MLPEDLIRLEEAFLAAVGRCKKAGCTCTPELSYQLSTKIHKQLIS